MRTYEVMRGTPVSRGVAIRKTPGAATPDGWASQVREPMSNQNPTEVGSFDEPRSVRALTEAMQTVKQAPDLYSVFSGSGSEYVVDLRGRPSCNCPDFLRRDDVTACKHIRRAYVETGRVAIPAAFETDAMDDLLVRAIDAGVARRAAADGRGHGPRGSD